MSVVKKFSGVTMKNRLYELRQKELEAIIISKEGCQQTGTKCVQQFKAGSHNKFHFLFLSYT